MMHLCRSQQQAVALSDVLLQYLESVGESDYSKWIKDNYLKSHWFSWFITASCCPGVNPNQNPIESYNKVVKVVLRGHLKARTTVVLNYTFPSILIAAGAKDDPTGAIYCGGPIPAEVIVRASLLMRKENFSKRYVKGSNSKILESMVFNAREYVCDGDNTKASPMDTHRATTYLKSLTGRLQSDEIWVNVQYRYMGAHQVSILDHDVEITHAQMNPTWSIEEVKCVPRP